MKTGLVLEGGGVREGKVFVIRPSVPPAIGRMEKDPQKVRALYELGRADALRLIPGLQEWLCHDREIL